MDSRLFDVLTMCIDNALFFDAWCIDNVDVWLKLGLYCPMLSRCANASYFDYKFPHEIELSIFLFFQSRYSLGFSRDSLHSLQYHRIVFTNNLGWYCNAHDNLSCPKNSQTFWHWPQMDLLNWHWDTIDHSNSCLIFFFYFSDRLAIHSLIQLFLFWLLQFKLFFDSNPIPTKINPGFNKNIQTRLISIWNIETYSWFFQLCSWYQQNFTQHWWWNAYDIIPKFYSNLNPKFALCNSELQWINFKKENPILPDLHQSAQVWWLWSNSWYGISSQGMLNLLGIDRYLALKTHIFPVLHCNCFP